MSPRDGYSPATMERIDAAALVAVRACRVRVSEGRRLALEGSENTAIKGWTKDLRNPLAYLVRVLDGRMPGKVEAEKACVTLDSAQRLHGGMHAMAARLHPTMEDAAAFMIRIGSLTGLNFQSVRDLSVDCIEPDALPDRARLRHSKNRANSPSATMTVADRGDLDVPGLVGLYLDLSRDLRRHAPPDLASRLFLYLGQHADRWLAAPDTWNRTRMQGAMKAITESVTDDDGHPINFEFSRIRPAVLAQIFEAGGLEAARRAGRHADSRTTLSYVAAGTGPERVDATIAAAQEDAIRCVDAAASGDAEAVAGLLGVGRERAERIVSGQADKLFVACKDDLSSPVRGQSRGRPCGAVWACLACENHILLERHLPRLIAYRSAAAGAAQDMTDDEWEDAYGTFCRLADAAIARYPADIVAKAQRDAEATRLRGCLGFRT